MRRALLSILAATLISTATFMSTEARAADSGGQFAVEGIGGSTCESFVAAKSESSDAYWMFLGWLDGYMTGIKQYAPETYDITPWQSQNLLAALFEKFCARDPGGNSLPAGCRVEGSFQRRCRQRFSEPDDVRAE